MSQIKPCPHCGQYDHVVATVELHSGSEMFRLGCTDCRCSVLGEDKRVVLETWQMRPYDNPDECPDCLAPLAYSFELQEGFGRKFCPSCGWRQPK